MPWLASALVLLVVATVGAGAADVPEARSVPRAPALLDPTRVVGPAECGECHEPETEVWKASQHVAGAKLLTRDARAKSIASALGVRRIKSDTRCIGCHFTPQQQSSDKLKAIAGVSCESCHGPARDWLEVHNDYGGEGVKRESESADHRAERLSRCDAAGMNRPDKLVALASRCYDCHILADEELVDVGGHRAVHDFELVAWAQGEIRHNFVRGSGSNVEAPPERLRVMFVIGHALQLEHALRGLAGATAPGNYADAMASLAERALGSLKHTQDAAATDEVAAMLDAARGLELQLGDANALRTAADLVRTATERFEGAHDGSDLGALAALLPAAADYQGQVAP